MSCSRAFLFVHLLKAEDPPQPAGLNRRRPGGQIDLQTTNADTPAPARDFASVANAKGNVVDDHQRTFLAARGPVDSQIGNDRRWIRGADHDGGSEWATGARKKWILPLPLGGGNCENRPGNFYRNRCDIRDYGGLIGLGRRRIGFRGRCRCKQRCAKQHRRRGEQHSPAQGNSQVHKSKGRLHEGLGLTSVTMSILNASFSLSLDVSPAARSRSRFTMRMRGWLFSKSARNCPRSW